MNALVAGVFVVPLVDQGIKFWLRQRLGEKSIGLGSLGNVRLVNSQIWLLRRRNRPSAMAMWRTWWVAAVLLVLLTGWAGSNGGFAGLLLGGSLSHALESSLRGRVSDYLCLRFWPAFNLADTAITVGSIGFVVGMFFTIRSASL